MLELGGELVRIAGLGESRGVDGAGADAGDHVEPQPALDDEMLARADLPAPLRPTARQDHALVDDVGCELGRRLLENVLDRRHDLLEHRLHGLGELVATEGALFLSNALNTALR